MEGVVTEGGVEPDGGRALMDSVVVGACFCGEGGKFWMEVGEEGELFAWVAEGLQECDGGEVFWVHRLRVRL